MDAYELVSAHKADLKAFLKMNIFRESQPTEGDVLEYLRANLCAESLYAGRLPKGPATLFRILGDLFIVKGLPDPRKQENRSIAYKLTGSFLFNDR